MVDIKEVKALREETGLSITECQKALEKTGSMEKAREALRAAGAAVSEKKANRTLGAGAVQAYIHATKEMGTMVELLCETDFVAKNEEFLALAYDLALHIAALKPRYTTRNDIPKEMMDQYLSEVEKEIPADAKPEVIENIRDGKLSARLKDVVLVEQAFIKDDTRSIRDLLDGAAQKFGERVEVGQFTIVSIK